MPPKYSYEIDRPIITPKNLKNQFRTSPCEVGCPAGNPIQKIHSLVEEGNYESALWYLKARNPLSGITGRVCPHPCQTECNRRHFDQAVSIQALERAAYEHADHSALPRPRRLPATGKSVAVIGGGPAGLSCAYFLGLLGHQVMVFESAPMPGGIPRLVIPDFRLPKAIVDREIGWMMDAGFHVRVNSRIGEDISFQKIREEYDAVVIAAGTPKERALETPGAERALKAMELLRKVHMGQRPEIGKNVVIVGGGGVAFDCAFTARRLGAESVQIICLEDCNAMVAPEDDLTRANEENIVIHNTCMIAGILEEDSQTSGVEFFNVSECFFDEAGRAHIKAASDESTFLKADTVIAAIGVLPDLTFLGQYCPEFTEKGTLRVNAEHATTLSGVYAAGDIVTGPSTVANAIGSGRQAAFGVHRFLTDEKDSVYFFNEAGFIEFDDGLSGTQPPHVVSYEEIYGVYHYEKDAAAASQSSKNNNNSHLPLTGHAEIQAEAKRCFHCGHCKSCGICVEDCPGYVLEMADENKPMVVYGEECWHCANCRTSCPCSALGFEFPLFMQV